MAIDLVTSALTDLVHDAVSPIFGHDSAELVIELLDDTATTTMQRSGDEVTIITGDIPAVWLRDSCAQMAPFVRLAGHLDDSDRRPILATSAAILRRHWRMILMDPYANAFKTDPAHRSDHFRDWPRPHPYVWERKFELDSLSFPIQLASALADVGEFGWVTPAMPLVFQTIVSTFDTESDHESLSDYRFRRLGGGPKSNLIRCGRGRRTAPVGMIWSGFRPSDDACERGFNVPGNLFAAHALELIAELTEVIDARLFERAGIDRALLAERARDRAGRVIAAVAEHAIANGPAGEPVLAYETDGRGHHLLMDDANNPSLLGLPYLNALPAGWDDLYASTRRFVLSADNPWYFTGSALSGIGSPHTGPGRVWPIALATQGLTSIDESERVELVRTLEATTDGTRRMHEGIDANDTQQYSRGWFSWANSMFCELVLDTSGLHAGKGKRPISELD